MPVTCEWNGCNDQFDTEHGMKSHHSTKHGVSIYGVDTQCAQCGTDLHLSKADYERSGNNFCRDKDCFGDWVSENQSGENHSSYVDRDSGGSELWHDEDRLRELYVDERLSCNSIADRWDCNDETIRRWLVEFDIDRREVGHSRYSEYPWREKETLENLYIGQKLSMQKVADRLGCNSQTVCNWLNKYDIETRDVTTEDVGAPYRNEETLRDLYEVQGFTLKTIGERFGCDETTVLHWVNNFDIPINHSKRDSLDHNTSNRYYGRSWPERRSNVLERDNYRCQETGMCREEHYKQYGTDLHVHHVVPFRLFEDSEVANREENLITLSAAVHRKHEQWADVVANYSTINARDRTEYQSGAGGQNPTPAD